MTRFHRIRTSIHFRHYFDAVHPLFWPVLFWSLGRMFKWMREENLSSVMFEITWWGGIEICILGDKLPQSAAPNPFAPTRPRWNDPIWASDVPVLFSTLTAIETRRRLPILHRLAGGGGSPHRGLTEGALTSPLNTT